MNMWLFLLLLIFVGCAQPNAPVAAPIVAAPQTLAAPSPTHTPTFTPTATQTPTPTPSPTNTATPTPTPTATAPAIPVLGNPRTAVLQPPTPQSNAICGVVDTLDFPMDPPNGDAVASGGRDFGVYRSRYDKYHAGEDWWQSRGQSNFGLPVYSIGHGQVTYAQPLGWGRDQGVVIIRHTFANGRSVLSFYGHLDPPSVTLKAGACVTRGQKIGEIGKPRTPPHLHFEMRTHMPDEPGGGYWPVDPTLAGWLPPSQTIWHTRMATAVGVTWARPFSEGDSKGIGLIDPTTMAVIEDGQLIGLDIASGAVRWRHEGPEGDIMNAMLDQARGQIFLVNRRSLVAAYALEEAPTGTLPADEPLWEMDVSAAGGPMLLPLPDGGIAVAGWRLITAISHSGQLLWEQEIARLPSSWTLFNDQLLFSTSGTQGGVWLADADGAAYWEGLKDGRLQVVGDQLWHYDGAGIYRLDPETRTVEPLIVLPVSYVGASGFIALPGGGALLAHQDSADRRLLYFDNDGALLWERSYARQVNGRPNLFLVGERPYLLTQDDRSGASYLSLYAIDLDDASLNHIFTGGTRSPISGNNWALPAGDLILIQVGGGSMVGLDPKAAEAAVQQ